MRVLVLGGDGFCGWPTSLYLSDRGHDITIADNLSRRKIDIELEVDSLTPIRPIGERLRVWKEVTGKDIGFVNVDLATEYDRIVELLEELRPGRHRALRRAARRAVLDAHREDQALHGRQQRPGDAQPAHRPGHHGHRGLAGAPGHHGRLRLRLVRQRAHPRGLPDRQGADPRRRAGAGDPAPGQPGLGLPPDQDPRPADVLVLRLERPAADHRPAPGHRLGHPDRADDQGRAAHQPVRLRRRLRHRAQPVPDAGLHRAPADRARHRRPDPRLHPHPGHRPVHRAGHRQPARGRRPSRWSATRSPRPTGSWTWPR